MGFMRINKGQRNWDGLDLATLQSIKTKLVNAYTERLAGNGVNTMATEEIMIAGLALRAVTLEELADQIADVANAIQKKLPGSTFTQASFGSSCASPPNPFGWQG